jgi:hypothetical protein
MSPADSPQEIRLTLRWRAAYSRPVPTSPRPSRQFTYKEFTDFARRFNQNGLLTAVAQRAASLPDDVGEMPTGRRRRGRLPAL